MKTVNLLKALGIALCVATASSAYAQASDAMSSDSAGMAAPAPSAKSMKKTNRTLGLQVRKALAKAQGFDVSNVFVRARSGAVTLTGSVPDAAQISKAEEVAKSVAGVKSVSNKLTVGTQGGGGG